MLFTININHQVPVTYLDIRFRDLRKVTELRVEDVAKRILSLLTFRAESINA